MLLRVKLNNEQLKVVSDIGVNLGNISLASIALPFLVPIVSRGALVALVGGGLATILFWSFSVVVIKDID